MLANMQAAGRSVNIIETLTFHNGYVNGSGTDNGFHMSEVNDGFVSLEGKSLMKVYNPGNKDWCKCVHFYDKNQEYTLSTSERSYQYGNGWSEIAIPGEAGYFRISIGKDYPHSDYIVYLY